jgi:hypothetical protein
VEAPELPLLDEPELPEELDEAEAASSSEPGPPSFEAPSVALEGNGRSFPPHAATRRSAANPARPPMPLPIAPKLAPRHANPGLAPKIPSLPPSLLSSLLSLYGGIIRPAGSGFRCQ